MHKFRCESCSLSRTAPLTEARPEDLNDDGIVDDTDLGIVLGTFGLNAWQWRYDALGRVVSAQSCGSAYQCAYDALGRRIWQSLTTSGSISSTSSGTQTTCFLYGPGFEIELDDEGNVKAETAFGLLGPLARWTGTGILGGTGAAIWYIKDRKLGSVRSLLKVTNGQVEWLGVYEYDKAGDMLSYPEGLEQPYSFAAGLRTRYEVGIGGYTNPLGGVYLGQLAVPQKAPLTAVEPQPYEALLDHRAPLEAGAGATDPDFSRRVFGGNLASKGFAQAEVAGEIGAFSLELTPGSGLLMAAYGKDGRGRPISDCDRVLSGFSDIPFLGIAGGIARSAKKGYKTLDKVEGRTLERVYQSANEQYKRQPNLTVAGRKLTSHAHRDGSIYPKVNGPFESSSLARELVEEVLTNPHAVVKSFQHKQHGRVSEVRIPGSYGILFTAEGRFITFLEP